MVYRCGEETISEESVAETVSVTSPLERFFHGIIEEGEEFDLRSTLLRSKADLLQSPVRGFSGCRIELLPHQVSIADTVSSRSRVRALLADETGLGKTIEACLILHRLLALERIGRVLIVLPEHLVHQWFVELLRRFNLTFRIFSKEYCGAFVGANPFLTDQLGICSIDYLVNDAALMHHAVEAPWDLLVVDEAHHLRQGSPAYALVKRLSERVDGLLLLTATPEQLGRENHFARLQLLDPHRYARYEDYLREVAKLKEVYHFVKTILHERNIDFRLTQPDKIDISVPHSLLSASEAGPISPSAKTPEAKLTLEQLLDLYGTGRIMFRNTRRNIAGFPQRETHLVPLAADAKLRDKIFSEIRHELLLPGALSSSTISPDDPRVEWLAQLIKEEKSAKFLVICSKKSKAESLQQAILHHSKITIALFHEEMTILQRDRNAAWFAEDHGARLLVSSEIGSEGRNFQFCQHLVLFDLPLNPELLEQRIGRLDRIGQRKTIHLHVPYIAGSPQETLCRWYHEGLDSFNRNSPAASGVFEVQREELLRLCGSPSVTTDEVDDFLNRTRTLREQFTHDHFEARDNLFEMLSFQPVKAQKLIAAIHDADRAGITERIMHRLFKHYGIAVDEAGGKKHALITDYLTNEGFPLPRNERPVITFDRQTALSREDVEFLTLDHPMVSGALDLYCASDRGTTALVKWNDPQTSELLLESVFVVECLAPAQLNANRFLPPSPLRIVVDHRAEDVTSRYPSALISAQCANETIQRLPIGPEALKTALTPMVDKSKAMAGTRMKPVIESAIAAMRTAYEHEIGRLRFFQEHKGILAAEEIEHLSREKDELEKHLRAPRIRLDSIRVIWRGPANKIG